METIRFRKWILQVDREATIRAYAETPTGGPEECGCSYCRNFATARERVYPTEFRDLLEQLGVDYRKEAEIWEASADKARLRFYAGWFHFVGEVVAVDESKAASIMRFDRTNTTLSPGLERVNSSFAIDFSNRGDLSHPAFSGQSIAQLDFYAEVPWVLDEEPI